MKISVTQDHIDHGKRRDCCNCPVALAARDAGCPAPVVFLGHFYPNWTAMPEARLGLPAFVTAFIHRFDYTQNKVSPFEFEVDWNP